MSKLPIPDGPEALTAEWLTAALRESGAIKGAVVKRVSTESLGRGSGLIGRIERLRPVYAAKETEAPRSIVAKFHSPDPDWRRRVAGLNLLEIRFYEEVADRRDLPTPIRYYSAIEPASGECILLLEDLAPARSVDTLAGCDFEDAELVVRSIANFHARWWNSPELGGFSWLKPLHRSAVAGYVEAIIAESSSRLFDGAQDLVARLKRDFRLVMAMAARPPLTIVHNDLAVKNLLFGTAQGDDLAFFDFQVVCAARGAIDVAHFLGSSVTVPLRRSIEFDLLKTYHSVLRERGIDDYEFDECVRDYRTGLLCNLVYLLAAMGYGVHGRGGAQAVEEALFERYSTAIADLDCEALLPL